MVQGGAKLGGTLWLEWWGCDGAERGGRVAGPGGRVEAVGLVGR